MSVILSFCISKEFYFSVRRKVLKRVNFTSNTDEKEDLLCIFQVERGFKSTLLFKLTDTNIESFLLNFDNTNIDTFLLNFDNKIKCVRISQGF